MTRARTVFFGSGGFGRAILEALIRVDSVEVVVVVSTPPKPAGRHGRPAPTPVAAEAEADGIPLLVPASIRTPDVATALGAFRPDLGVLADYGRIVPPDLIRLPPHGILNVHPSLLPRHRGATPIPATILEGDPEAGVSIIAMDDGLDTGPIVASTSWPTSGGETAPELESTAATAGGTLLATIIPRWLRGEVGAAPQDSPRATLTKPLRREDGRLDPAQPARLLERRVRALLPWPGSFLDTTVGRVIVHAATIATPTLESVEGGSDDRLGRLVRHGDGLALVTSDGRLALERIQLPGGRAMAAAELRRGHPELVGAEVRP